MCNLAIAPGMTALETPVNLTFTLCKVLQLSLCMHMCVEIQHVMQQER